MPSYEADALRARLHHPDAECFSLVPAMGGKLDISVPHFRLRDTPYGREMAGAICTAIGIVNKKYNIRHFGRDGVTEIWVGQGCV